VSGAFTLGEDNMKIIVGVDDSVYSEAAVKHVATLPWPKDARFIVLSAAAPVLIGRGEATTATLLDRVVDEQRKYHRQVAEKAAARLMKAGLEAEARIVLGDPRWALEEEATREKADLIVVGSHGRTGVERVILGSVAAHIVKHAPCSVLVVKTPR
jgi:nucleotide-binding universal stress UspA family protein